MTKSFQRLIPIFITLDVFCWTTYYERIRINIFRNNSTSANNRMFTDCYFWENNSSSADHGSGLYCHASTGHNAWANRHIIPQDYVMSQTSATINEHIVA